MQREDDSYVAGGRLAGARHATAELALAARSAHGARRARSRRRARRAREQSFTDRGRELDTDDVLIQGPDTANPNRLVYRTARLARDVRLSGTPWVKLRLSIDNRTAANLTAVLVDYDGAARGMVTRGWIDPQNRHGARALGAGSSRAASTGCGFDLQPDDHVFRAGHRIGLVVVSTDHDYTIRPKPGTRLTLDPGGSALSLPVVGGRGRSNLLTTKRVPIVISRWSDAEDDEERRRGAVAA